MKFYCNELSLVVCFTRITVNVPRIVINCLGNIASGCGWLQQPCHAGAGLCDGGHLWLRQNSAAMSSQRWHVRRHGIYGCGRIIHLNMKTRHCISGWIRVVLSGLWCTTPHSHLMTTPPPLAVMADRNPPSPKRQGDASILLQINEATIVLQQVYAPQWNREGLRAILRIGATPISHRQNKHRWRFLLAKPLKVSCSFLSWFLAEDAKSHQWTNARRDW